MAEPKPRGFCEVWAAAAAAAPARGLRAGLCSAEIAVMDAEIAQSYTAQTHTHHTPGPPKCPRYTHDILP